MIEDKILILKFKAGSSDALARIYKKYKNTLLKLAAALTNDSDAAEDIVHDVFVFFLGFRHVPGWDLPVILSYDLMAVISEENPWTIPSVNDYSLLKELFDVIPGKVCGILCF